MPPASNTPPRSTPQASTRLAFAIAAQAASVTPKSAKSAALKNPVAGPSQPSEQSKAGPSQRRSRKKAKEIIEISDESDSQESYVGKGKSVIRPSKTGSKSQTIIALDETETESSSTVSTPSEVSTYNGSIRSHGSIEPFPFN